MNTHAWLMISGFALSFGCWIGIGVGVLVGKSMTAKKISP